MGNIKIIKGVFDSSLELEHAEVAARFPDITVDYAHETLDFNRDYIKHPEASFYGDVQGDSMKCITPCLAPCDVVTRNHLARWKI